MVHAPPHNPPQLLSNKHGVIFYYHHISTGFSSEGEEAEESPTSCNGSPRKEIRYVDSKYQSKWSHKYGMKHSGRVETFAYCSVCNVDFSVAGGSIFQVKHHCQSKKYSNRAKELNYHTKIDSLVTHQAQYQVTCAELYFARFVAEHNLPFALADHFNQLCSLTFPDSKIAAGFSCARTKAAALITHALGPPVNNPLIKACKEQPFTIICDGGNDNFEKKYFGIMVRLWDDKLGKVITRFLDAPVCNIATRKTMFRALAVVLEARGIP